MPLLVGLDDTDSTAGGCTTHVALAVLGRLQGVGVWGQPRLVRLNPNIPWKTRGNGAVVLCLAPLDGQGTLLGEAEGRPILGTQVRAPPSREAVTEALESVFEEFARVEEPNTHPAFVLAERRPPRSFYEKAVRSVVSMDEALAMAEAIDAEYRLYKKGRGLVGALAALAWTPRDRTHEVITYRRRARWGTPRQLDHESVVQMDAAFPSTFNNHDPLNGRVAIAPNSPCPVLFGIRGDDPRDLAAARQAVRSEAYDDWLLFETNQGTDDHIVPTDVGALRAYASVAASVEVTSPPRDLPGGHVVFRVADGTGEVDCTAYEPSKQFRQVARALVPGDRVEVAGAVRETPRTINLERLGVLALAAPKVKGHNPACPRCGRRMKSAGRRAGYRCRPCHARLPEEAATVEALPRALVPGTFEPPVCSRRHIAKPLKRMGVVPPPYPGPPHGGG